MWWLFWDYIFIYYCNYLKCSSDEGWIVCNTYLQPSYHYRGRNPNSERLHIWKISPWSRFTEGLLGGIFLTISQVGLEFGSQHPSQMIHNCLSLQLQETQHPFLNSAGLHLSTTTHTHIKIKIKQKGHRLTGEIYSSVFPELYNTVIVLKLGGNFKYWALLKIWVKHSLPVQSLCSLQDLGLTCNQDTISPAILLF